jgi:hypothetical protein
VRTTKISDGKKLIFVLWPINHLLPSENETEGEE